MRQKMKQENPLCLHDCSKLKHNCLNSLLRSRPPKSLFFLKNRPRSSSGNPHAWLRGGRSAITRTPVPQLMLVVHGLHHKVVRGGPSLAGRATLPPPPESVRGTARHTEWQDEGCSGKGIFLSRFAASTEGKNAPPNAIKVSDGHEPRPPKPELTHSWRAGRVPAACQAQHPGVCIRWGLGLGPAPWPGTGGSRGPPARTGNGSCSPPQSSASTCHGWKW